MDWGVQATSLYSCSLGELWILPSQGPAGTEQRLILLHAETLQVPMLSWEVSSCDFPMTLNLWDWPDPTESNLCGS